MSRVYDLDMLAEEDGDLDAFMAANEAHNELYTRSWRFEVDLSALPDPLVSFRELAGITAPSVADADSDAASGYDTADSFLDDGDVQDHPEVKTNIEGFFVQDGSIPIAVTEVEKVEKPKAVKRKASEMEDDDGESFTLTSELKKLLDGLESAKDKAGPLKHAELFEKVRVELTKVRLYIESSVPRSERVAVYNEVVRRLGGVPLKSMKSFMRNEHDRWKLAALQKLVNQTLNRLKARIHEDVLKHEKALAEHVAKPPVASPVIKAPTPIVSTSGSSLTLSAPVEVPKPAEPSPENSLGSTDNGPPKYRLRWDNLAEDLIRALNLTQTYVELHNIIESRNSKKPSGTEDKELSAKMLSEGREKSKLCTKILSYWPEGYLARTSITTAFTRYKSRYWLEYKKVLQLVEAPDGILDGEVPTRDMEAPKKKRQKKGSSSSDAPKKMEPAPVSREPVDAIIITGTPKGMMQGHEDETPLRPFGVEPIAALPYPAKVPTRGSSIDNLPLATEFDGLPCANPWNDPAYFPENVNSEITLEAFLAA